MKPVAIDIFACETSLRLVSRPHVRSTPLIASIALLDCKTFREFYIESSITVNASEALSQALRICSRKG